MGGNNFIISVNKFLQPFMKPFKTGVVIASWLLRIMLAWFIYIHYFQSFTDFELKDFSFYISTAYMLAGLLLIIGGFMQKPAMTVVSGLFIFVLPIVMMIHQFPGDLQSVLLTYLIPLAVGMYFFTSGNG